MIQTLWPTLILVMASLVLFTSAVTPATVLHTGYDKYVDMHNYGYVLKYKREMSVAMYDAKLIFHLQLPDWRIRFDGLNHNCRMNMDTSLICVQLREILDAARDIKSHSQLHVQYQMRRIHEMLTDVPFGGTGDRSRRGFLTDVVSRVTGLASKDDFNAVEHILEQVETGIYQAAKLWGSGVESGRFF